MSGIPGWLGTLSASERRLWAAFGSGQRLDLRVGDAAKDDPATADSWGPGRQVRAAVVAALALGASPPTPGRVPALRLVGARVVGTLDLADGLVNYSIELSECHFDGPVNLDCATTRSVVLSGSHLPSLSAYGATVRGSLALRRAVITAAPGQRAVHANRIEVATDIRASGLRAVGSVCLVGAQVHGLVNLGDADLSNPGRDALNAGGLRVAGSLFCDGVRADGETRLPGAVIGGELNFDGAVLRNPRPVDQLGCALYGEALSVRSDLLARGLRADGVIHLTSCQIGSGIKLHGARLDTPDGVALSLANARIGRSLYLDEGFRTTGEVRCTGAVVTGHLNLTGIESPDGTLGLFATRIGVIRHDRGPDALAGWPARLNLDGCVYDTFDPYLPARQRLKMMDHQVGQFRSQPYEQLAAYYRGLGHDNHARTVLLAKLRAHRRALPWYLRPAGYLLDTMVGYGYRPLRAIGWAVALLVAGGLFFAAHPPAHVHADDSSAFNPWLYTADLLIPIVRFGQQDPWQAHGGAAVVAAVLTVLGWALSVAIAAAAARTLNRN